MPLAPSSIRTYVSTLKRILGADLSARQAAPGFGDFLSELPAQLLVDAETTNATRGIIRGALRWMYAEAGRAAEGEALAKAIPYRHEVRKKKRYPTREEIVKFLAVAAERKSPQREMLQIPLALGLRAAEYLNLSREAVQQALGTEILTVQRKGGLEGELPTPRATGAFKSLLKVVRDGGGGVPWDFVWQAYAPTERAAYWAMRRLVASVAKESGAGSAWTPHTMRHAFASEMIRDGAPLPVVQQALGHASYQTTVDTYVHLDAKDLEKWMAPK